MSALASLGPFLKARRAALDPVALGLPPVAGPRRVAGLRREEAAQLAGISVDYYTRLEQGRVGHVSDSVLTALARALALSADETRYLHDLLAPRRRAEPRAARQRVRPLLQQLLDAMGTPAVVFGRYSRILAWNPSGRALYLPPDAAGEGEVDAARLLFLDPRMREVYPEFERVATDVVAGLRAEAGRRPDDPELARLVGDLSVRSELFRTLWAAQTVREKSHGTKLVRNPVVGELTLHFETLRLPDDHDQAVVAYTAEPGSPSEQALELLASWTAGARAAGPPPTGRREEGRRAGR